MRAHQVLFDFKALRAYVPDRTAGKSGLIVAAFQLKIDTGQVAISTIVHSVIDLLNRDQVQEALDECESARGICRWPERGMRTPRLTSPALSRHHGADIRRISGDRRNRREVTIAAAANPSEAVSSRARANWRLLPDDRCWRSVSARDTEDRKKRTGRAGNADSVTATTAHRVYCHSIESGTPNGTGIVDGSGSQKSTPNVVPHPSDCPAKKSVQKRPSGSPSSSDLSRMNPEPASPTTIRESM